MTFKRKVFLEGADSQFFGAGVGVKLALGMDVMDIKSGLK